MTRVCIFADFPANALQGEAGGRGGGQGATWLPQLAVAWKDQADLDLHWCLFDRTVSQPEIIQRWNQSFHRIPTPGISLSMLAGRWPHRLACRRLLRELQPDVIHCWGTENLNGAALYEFGGPSILSMQGIITTYYKTGDLTGWRWRLFRHWEPLAVRRASVVTSESQWGLDQVARIHPAKVVRKIEYGVSPGFYDVQWAPDPEQPRFLFVGGFNRLKGVDILLEMLRSHRDRHWKMVFAGAGYLEQSLRELGDPNVEVAGLLRSEQVREQMAKAWALVLPSRADTSPNVVKEARVIGLPVVASSHGGHAEYVTDGIDGYCLQSHNPALWFAAIDRLACDYERCRTMGGVNHAHFREHFQSGATAAEFAALYHELAATREMHGAGCKH